MTTTVYLHPNALPTEPFPTQATVLHRLDHCPELDTPERVSAPVLVLVSGPVLVLVSAPVLVLVSAPVLVLVLVPELELMQVPLP